MRDLKDYQLLILVGIVFLQLGLWLPFWLYPGNGNKIPFGISFLADAGVLMLLGFAGWAIDYYQRARREEELQRWISAREALHGK